MAQSLSIVHTLIILLICLFYYLPFHICVLCVCWPPVKTDKERTNGLSMPFDVRRSTVVAITFVSLFYFYIFFLVRVWRRRGRRGRWRRERRYIIAEILQKQIMLISSAHIHIRAHIFTYTFAHTHIEHTKS